MAFGIGLTTPVPSPIAYALVGGLSSDSVVMHNDALKIYPEVNLIDFESATKEALTRLHPHKIERVWDDRDGQTKIFKHEGFFIDHREIKVDTTPEKMFEAVKKMGGWFTIETIGDNQILVHLKMKVPGQGWVEWKKGRASNYLAQTVFFTPRGFGGFLFWYLLSPFFIMVFNRWLKNVARNSVVK
jgi:hypothetical protein